MQTASSINTVAAPNAGQRNIGKLHVLGDELLRLILYNLKPRHMLVLMQTCGDLYRLASLTADYWDRVAVHVMYRDYIPLPEPTWYSMTFTPTGYNKAMESFYELVAPAIRRSMVNHNQLVVNYDMTGKWIIGDMPWDGTRKGAVRYFFTQKNDFERSRKEEERQWEHLSGLLYVHCLTTRSILFIFFHEREFLDGTEETMRTAIRNIEDNMQISDSVKRKLVKDMAVFFECPLDNKGRVDEDLNIKKSWAMKNVRDIFQGSI